MNDELVEYALKVFFVLGFLLALFGILQGTPTYGFIGIADIVIVVISAMYYGLKRK